MRSLSSRFSTLAAAAASLFAIAAFGPERAFAVEPFASATEPILAVHGSHPREAETAPFRGEADPAKPLSMSVVFALRNRKALDKLLANQHDSASPVYHHWLTPEEFASRFGPSTQDFEAMKGWLISRGFRIDKADLANRQIGFSGTVAQAEQTFRTKIHKFSEDSYANDSDPWIPARFAAIVGSISGLDNFTRAVPASAHLRSRSSRSLRSDGVSGSSAPRNGSRLAADSDPSAAKLPARARGGSQPLAIVGGIGPAFGPADFRTFYDETPLITSGIDGSKPNGGCLAIVGDSDFLPGAITSFDNQFGLPASAITKVVAGTDPGFNNDEVEALLDLEWSHAAAPGAPQRFYVGNLLQAIETAATDANGCAVISISFSFCGASPSFFSQTLDSVFAQAASMGRSIFVSSDDQGAAGLAFDAITNSCVTATTRTVNEMSADPNVTSVGGTAFNPVYSGGNDSGSVSERVWNDPQDGLAGGASGGGRSTVFSKPIWQKGTGVPNDGARDVPDVAMIASPNFPGSFWGNDRSCDSGGCNGSGPAVIDCCIGGTSLSAPLWAGIAKLIGHQGNTALLGSLNPTVYSLANKGLGPSGFRDVTQSNNTFNSVSGFSAGSGYDQSTGWGTVDIATFVGAYVGTIASATPTATPSPTPTVTAAATPTAIATTTADPTQTSTPTAAATTTATPTATATFAPGRLRVSVPVLFFPNRMFGNTGQPSAPKRVVVSNPRRRRRGPATFAATPFNISGDFTVSQNSCVGILAPGAYCAIDVIFTPTALHKRVGLLTINDDAPNPQKVWLLGFGVRPRPLVVSPLLVRSLPQAVGSPSPPMTVTLTNKSPVDTTIEAAQTTGPFSLASNSCGVLKPADSCTISVVFTPMTRGSKIGTLIIDDNAAGSPHRVMLSGIGVSP